jgi:hypothetical protein
MSHYTGLVLLYFIFWLVVRLYRGSVDFTWWPINSHDEDTLKEEMEDYVESNRLSVLANVTPEVKSVVIILAIIDAVESTCEFYLYFVSMFTKNVSTKIIYRYLDIYRIKLLPEYMDEVLFALSILGAIYGIYCYVVIS